MSMNTKKGIFFTNDIYIIKTNAVSIHNHILIKKFQRKNYFSLTFTSGNKMKCNKSTINNNNQSTNTLKLETMFYAKRTRIVAIMNVIIVIVIGLINMELLLIIIKRVMNSIKLKGTTISE